MTIATSQPVSAWIPTDAVPLPRRVGRRKTIRTLVWAAALLLFAEAGVRARAWYRHGLSGPVADIYEKDPKVGRRPSPGATLSGIGRRLTINRWGFRGADIPLVKPAGISRIAVIGDSPSFGMEASDDESVWVSRLVSTLNKGEPDRYDAINGAVPGYTLGLSTRGLMNRIARFNPDVIIAYQMTADISAQAALEFSRQRESASTKSILAEFVGKQSLLVNLIRLNTAAFKARYFAQRCRDRLNSDGLVKYERKLQELVQHCRDRSWRLVLCTCPRSFGDATAPSDQYTLAASALASSPGLSLKGLNDAYMRYNEVIRAVARTEGILLVDLDKRIPKRSDFFTDAIHLNDLGHRMVAEAIAEALSRVR